MTRKDDERIQDTLGACGRLSQIAARGRLSQIAARGRSAYDGDWVVQDAANYNLTVIGEALDSLSAQFVARHRDLPVRQAKSLRNKLAHEYFVADPDILSPAELFASRASRPHEYFVADPDILWDTITQDVPALDAKLAAIRGPAGQ